MVNMYEVVYYLCKRENISVAKMCRDIGMQPSIITDLKHGRTKNLTHANMVKIANYFNISTDVFNEGVLEETFPNQADAESVAGYHHLLKKEAPTLTEKDERDIYKKWRADLEELENSQEALMFDGQPLDDETKELLAISLKNSLELSKKIAKQKYTPKKYRKQDKSEGD